MYRELPQTLTTEQINDLIALSRGVDLRPGPGGARITPCALDAYWMAWWSALGQVQSAMFIALQPTSQIPAHTDQPIPGRRYHVPIQVNDGCWVFHDGQWLQLNVGRIYEMDPSQTHGAVNWGTTPRSHLIVDVL